MVTPPDGSNEWFCKACFSCLCRERGCFHYYSLSVRLLDTNKINKIKQSYCLATIGRRPCLV
jgi:hypothetical protein